LEKPFFKEKIRLRSYGKVSLTDNVFLESKKKFDGVVNKRRTTFVLQDAYEYFESGNIIENPKMNKQVMKEINYIMNMYNLKPRVFISYDRLAFFEKNNSDFRLTLDTNIQTRRDNLRLDYDIYGNQLLQPGQWIMEAKAFKAFPLWFVHFLSERKIFQTSFSKYGTEYRNYINTLEK
jgi:SPX domain protein involved in polyphosphate accumulation